MFRKYYVRNLDPGFLGFVLAFTLISLLFSLVILRTSRAWVKFTYFLSYGGAVVDWNLMFKLCFLELHKWCCIFVGLIRLSCLSSSFSVLLWFPLSCIAFCGGGGLNYCPDSLHDPLKSPPQIHAESQEIEYLSGRVCLQFRGWHQTAPRQLLLSPMASESCLRGWFGYAKSESEFQKPTVECLYSGANLEISNRV